MSKGFTNLGSSSDLAQRQEHLRRAWPEQHIQKDPLETHWPDAATVSSNGAWLEYSKATALTALSAIGDPREAPAGLTALRSEGDSRSQG